ncbi:MAG: hypothetical protein NZ895_02130 [Archaeoglobaceae archaeon]|nr:hypothetical protein [Archaeoglobaceae archaeon]MCX8152158.1 hypothetical protein [Archaeoglobaceae archaeon]MDW8013874.1 hypothetical protein [Archaeoglobaceae archaeon]
MDDFEFNDDEIEIEGGDEIKLAEIYKVANKLIKLLEEIKSFELREAVALMLIKELIGDDKILLGIATKMLQDLSYGFEEDESYVS